MSRPWKVVGVESVSKAFGPKCSREDDGLVHRCPLMRVLRILPAKIGEELSCLELKVSWQGGRLQIGFLELDLRFVVLVQLENDIPETFEIRVHSAVHGNFSIAQREAAFNWIVIAQLKEPRRV